MLKKLLKYDLKANAIYMLILSAIFLAITIITRFAMSNIITTSYYSSYYSSGYNVLNVLSSASFMVLYVISIGAMAIVPFILSFKRFYSNMMGMEGYLSFTLPVKTSTHLFSKIYAALIWMVGSLILIVISFFIVFGSYADWSLYDFFYDVFYALNLDQLSIVMMYVIDWAVRLISLVIIMYSAICLGNLAGKRRLLASVGIYIGINIVISIITTIASTILTMATGLYTTNNFLSLGLSTLIHAGVCVGGFILCQYIMSKKLNLE